MDNLHIKETGETPEILFDYDKGELTISGKSYPENVNETYEDLFSTIDEYKLNPKKKTTLNFYWLYYNTSTSKIIVKILSELKASDTNLEVNWNYKKGFNMMKEKGELISSIMKIEININEQE